MTTLYKSSILIKIHELLRSLTNINTIQLAFYNHAANLSFALKLCSHRYELKLLYTKTYFVRTPSQALTFTPPHISTVERGNAVAPNQRTGSGWHNITLLTLDKSLHVHVILLTAEEKDSQAAKVIIKTFKYMISEAAVRNKYSKR